MQYSTNIRKKDKGWQYIITYKDLSGKWKTKSKQGFKTRQLARDAMDDMITELKDNISSGIDSNSVTFKQFSDMYIEHMELHREANTILEMKRVQKTFVDLSNKELSKITKLDVQRIVDKLVKRGLKIKTIKSYIARLKSMFYSAKDDYNLIYNIPLNKLVIKEDKDNDSRTNKRALSKVEIKKILEFLETYQNKDYYYICSIALKAGLRLGEILGLNWQDIDFKENTISINKQWKLLKGTSKYGYGSPKSKNSYRTVPLSNSLKKDILKLKEINKSNNVISFKDSSRIFNYKNTDSVSICINRLFKINKFNCTVHELRHTFATNLIANGIDFKTAASLLGHDVKETMKTYSHVTDDMKKKAEKLINELF